MIPRILAPLAIRHSHVREFLGEFLGTTVLLILGAGVSAQHVLGDALPDDQMHTYGGFLTVCISWGLAVSLGVHVASKAGAGHINSAVTLGLALLGKVAWTKVPLYWLAQQLGAFFGSILVLGVYYSKLQEYEVNKLATRTGSPTSSNNTVWVPFTMEHTGIIFVTQPNASPLTCFLDQVLVTSLLVGCAVAISEHRGNIRVPPWAQAPMLGLLFTALVSSFALNAGAALNPARDFGPRVMLWMCGWGRAAFSSKHYYFWVPIAGPLVGGPLGAFWYELLVGTHLKSKSRSPTTEDSSCDDKCDKRVGPDRPYYYPTENHLQSASQTTWRQNHHYGDKSASAQDAYPLLYTPTDSRLPSRNAPYSTLPGKLQLQYDVEHPEDEMFFTERHRYPSTNSRREQGHNHNGAPKYLSMRA